MQVTSRQGQWLGDIAVREAGSLEQVMNMAIANELSLSESLLSDTPVEVGKVIDLRTATYYKTNGIYPATATYEIEETISTSGIGAMTIEVNFIVS